MAIYPLLRHLQSSRLLAARYTSEEARCQNTTGVNMSTFTFCYSLLLVIVISAVVTVVAESYAQWKPNSCYERFCHRSCWLNAYKHEESLLFSKLIQYTEYNTIESFSFNFSYHIVLIGAQSD